MKPLLTAILIVVGVSTGALPPSAAQSSSTEEKAQVSPPSESALTESPPNPAPPSTPSEIIEEEPVRAEDSLHFETKAYRRTIRKDREMEALRFHQNTLLSRFQNTHNQGQVFLTFSGDGVDLNLRNPNGSEAPVGHLNLPPRK